MLAPSDFRHIPVIRRGGFRNGHNHSRLIGKAGEFYTAFDLSMAGYTAFLSGEGLPYDLILETDDQLFRISVKAASYPTRGIYCFECIRSHKFVHQQHGIDLLALVALDIRRVAYIPFTRSLTKTVRVLEPGSQCRSRVAFSFDTATIHSALHMITSSRQLQQTS